MQVYPVGEFKAKFSQVLKRVQAGKSVGISYGKNKKTVAIMSPAKKKKSNRIKLGLWKGKAKFTVGKDFKFKSTEEFLAS